jgi:Ca-activated chloride channel family protein
MMPFARWPVLLLAVIPLTLLVRVWLRTGPNVVLPFDHGHQRSGRWLGGLVNLVEMIPPLVLMIVIFVLAGPQQLSEPKTKRGLTNIEFCVDISGSMSAPFGEGSRYDASMEAINEFLDFREGDAFGLTFFGNNVLHWVPLTNDTSAIRCSIPFMRPEVAPPWFGGTEIGKALLACKKRLSDREEGDRMIILVSDGHSFDLGNGNDQKIARRLREAGIIVYAIHIYQTAVPPEISNIAGATGGGVFQPGDVGALQAVFQRIDMMQQAELEKMGAEAMDAFGPFCVALVVLITVWSILAYVLRYTPW